jgi:NAD(P)-dependent dehydrogenase (short-subunit alcohol dehydrogenase family)
VPISRVHSNKVPGSGIGKHCALAFAREGVWGVVFADVDESAAINAAKQSEDVAVRPGYQAIAITVDITDETAVEAMVAAAIKSFGRLDYALNPTGVSLPPPSSNNVHKN